MLTLLMLQTTQGYGYAGQTVTAPDNAITQGLIARGAAVISTDPPSFKPLYPPSYLNAAMIQGLSTFTAVVGTDGSYLSQTNLNASYAAKPTGTATTGYVVTAQADGTAVWAAPTGGGGLITGEVA